MADFAHWCVAAALALGLTEAQALTILRRAGEEAVALTLEDDPTSEAITALLEGRERWAGTAADLLDEMHIRIPKEKRGRGFPETPRAVANQLRRIAPALRASGIDLSFQRDGHEGRRTIVAQRIAVPDPTPEGPPRGPDAAPGLAPTLSGSRVPTDPPQQDSPRHAASAASRSPDALSLGDDGKRVFVRNVGSSLGWPHFPFGPGIAIAAGKEAWETFAARASQDDVDAAVQAFLQVDEDKEA
jgi:hypothetical protein